MTDNLASRFAAEPPDHTMLVVIRDGVPQVVERDDKLAAEVADPCTRERWWSQTQVRPMTFELALDGADEVFAVVALERSGLVGCDADVSVPEVDQLYGRIEHAFDTAGEVHGLELPTLRQLVRELHRAAVLAIVHDRQPYPTADAYDRACVALHKYRERADRAERERDEALAKLAESEVAR